MNTDINENRRMSLTLPLKLPYMQAALDCVQTLARGMEFDTREQGHIRLALEETLEFIARAALAGQPDAVVSVVFEERSDGLLIRLTEQGMPLDIEKLPGFSVKEALHKDQSDGLSLHLTRNVTDSMTFKNRGRAGLDIEILKLKAALHVREHISTPETGARGEPPPSTTKTAFTIRPALPSEALAISQCAYLTYGHTYEDYIYYPDRITELNQTGELRSLVAVNDRNVVMGHCALKFESARADRAELGVLFVRPEYRRHGLGAALWGAAVQLGRELKLETIYARSVTGHRTSQVIAAQHGFHDSALLLALFPTNVDIKCITGVQPGKMSGVLQTLYLNQPRPRRIYPPANHAGMVEELYRRTGIPVEVNPAVPTRNSKATGAPKLRTQRLKCFNAAKIDVAASGESIETVARWCVGMTRKICAEKTDAVYLYLNIEEPAAAAVGAECARAGFIFAGIAPGEFAEGDALILQYINHPADPFQALTAGTDTALMLRDYIKSAWPG